MPRTLNASPGRAPEHNVYDLRDVFPTTGNIWFVDSGASSSGSGLTPEAAVTTIDAAINKATASNGDIIIVMEGHAETISGAAGIALDKAGITIVGLGRGRNRPVITFSAVASSFDISAANCHVENLVLAAGEDHTAMVNVTAADVTLKNCEIILATTSKEAVIGVLANASGDRMRVEGCHIHDIGVAGCDHAISFGAGDHTVIKDNIITGLFAVGGAIENSAAAADVVIQGNVIVNRTADGANKTIVFHASTTGLIVDNRMAIIDSCCVVPVTAAGAFVSHNYFTGAAGVTASVLQ